MHDSILSILFFLFLRWYISLHGFNLLVMHVSNSFKFQSYFIIFYYNLPSSFIYQLDRMYVCVCGCLHCVSATHKPSGFLPCSSTPPPSFEDALRGDLIEGSVQSTTSGNTSGLGSGGSSTTSAQSSRHHHHHHHHHNRYVTPIYYYYINISKKLNSLKIFNFFFFLKYFRT